LAEIEFDEDTVRDAISQNMAQVHITIDDANQDFLKMMRRYNYTTPTSFLELINFYKFLLGKNRGKITDKIERLTTGLTIMEQTATKVEGLKDLLAKKMVDVEIEEKNTDKFIEIVTKEGEVADKEAEVAAK